jgi:hypothetical protein
VEILKKSLSRPKVSFFALKDIFDDRNDVYKKWPKTQHRRIYSSAASDGGFYDYRRLLMHKRERERQDANR